jgi:putative redox protein
MIKCKNTNQNYACITSISEFSIISDTGIDKGGSGQGIRPHDLLTTAFASCLNITARMICDKLNIPYESITTKVDLVRENTKTTFNYKFEFDKSVSINQIIKIRKLLKSCPVQKTLSVPIEFNELK